MIRISFALILISALLSTSLAATIPDVSANVTIDDLAESVGGDPVCTLARRQVTASLIASTRDLQSVGTAGARSTVVRSTVRQALEGMSDVSSGITQVGFALLAGDEPTQASRDLIASGFESIKEALDAIARASPAVATRVTRARASLTRAIAAGNRLIVECGGFDPISISTAAPAASTTTTRGRQRTIKLTAQPSTEATSSTTASEEVSSSLSVLTVTADPTISTAVVTQTVVQTVTGGPAPTSDPEDIPSDPLPTLSTEDIPSDPTITDVPEDTIPILS